MAGSTSDQSYVETEQFALNFPIVMVAVSTYMKKEYDEGRLVDTNYATVQAQAIQSAIQATLTLTMQTDSQANQAALILAQKDMVDQQKLTEEQNTAKATYEVSTLLPDEHNLKLGQVALISQQKLTEEQNTAKVAYEVSTLLVDEHSLKQSQKDMVNQQKLTEVQNTAKVAYEVSTLLVDEHNLKQSQKSQIDSQKSQIDSQKSLLDQQKLTEVQKTITETNQGVLVADQALMIVAQTAEIAPNAAKQRAVQDAQIAQVAAETSYTGAKETTMVESRIDNLVIEDLKAQMQQIATVGAGGLVPDTHDFSSANSLREALYKRAKGEVLPNITFTASTTYTKAT